jgi:undecaprenyl-phosphate 4-deoxy-4-formamido-L-arabinose transferase
MLDVALESGVQLVYATPTNRAPHGAFRNMMSQMAKRTFQTLLSDCDIGLFNSFRLIHGEIARGLAAYCGPNVYLDCALCWMVDRSGSCPVELRDEGERRSGYNLKSLIRHFLRLVLTSGTRPLRIISLMGFCSIILSTMIGVSAIWHKFTGDVTVPGWASTILIISFFSGCILLSLGVIAEYLGVTLSMSMGKPLYVVVSKPYRKHAA